MNNQPNTATSGNGVLQVLRNQWDGNGRLKFVIIALGIFISYLYVGLCQEKIMKTPYGENKEKFTYANTLVEVSLVSGLIFINIWILFQPQKKDTTHFGYYAASAVANTLAMTTSYMALRWVSFPTQVIFKSGKPISVMVFGLLICKRYTIQRYFFVLIIVVGVIIFNLYEPKKPEAPKTTKAEGKAFDINEFAAENQQLLGISLLCLSLAMDGVLGMIQDKIRAAHKPTSQQFMLSTSMWGSGLLLIVIIATGELVEFYHFALRHPEVLWHMATFGLAGAIGQMFIYTMVASFGALANSVTTTVRKFFSVVCSIIFYRHASNLIQWSGAALVFSALLGDAFFGKKELTCGKKKDSELPSPPAAEEIKTVPQQVGHEQV